MTNPLITGIKADRYLIKSIVASNEKELRAYIFSDYDIVYVRKTIILSERLKIAKKVSIIGEGDAKLIFKKEGFVLIGDGISITNLEVSQLVLTDYLFTIDAQISNLYISNIKCDSELILTDTNGAVSNGVVNKIFTSSLNPCTYNAENHAYCKVTEFTGEVEFTFSSNSNNNTIGAHSLSGGVISTINSLGENCILPSSLPTGISGAYQLHPTDQKGLTPSNQFYSSYTRFEVGAGTFTQTTAGTGAITNLGAIGGLSLSTAAVADSACISTPATVLSLTKPMVNNLSIKIPTLSTAAQEFIYRGGFIDVFGAGDITDGVYIEYDRTISSNWRICTANGGARTKTTSSIPVTTTEVKLSIYASSSGAKFFINGQLAGTISTNLPAGVFGYGAKIEKTVGATARSIEVLSIGFEAYL